MFTNDEPTGNLDKANSLAIMELFSSFNRSGMTIVMVTHSPDVAAYASEANTYLLSMTEKSLNPFWEEHIIAVQSNKVTA
ncbi:MAG: hypothetical protein ACLVJH_00990 [Faecalibacterium prausnitzii]